jgi:hypothetical protein
VLVDQLNGCFSLVPSASGEAWTQQQLRYSFEAARYKRDGFVRNNNLNWTRELDNYLVNRNNTKHSRTKHTPKEIWNNTRVPLAGQAPADTGDDVLDMNQIQHKVKERTVEQAKKTLDKHKDQTFIIGDKVRVSIARLDSHQREIIKKGDGKYLPVLWSPRIFTIASVHKPKVNTLQKPRYKLKQSEHNKLNILFWGSELQKAGDNKEDSNVDYKKLNGLNRNR